MNGKEVLTVEGLVGKQKKGGKQRLAKQKEKPQGSLFRYQV